MAGPITRIVQRLLEVRAPQTSKLNEGNNPVNTAQITPYDPKKLKRVCLLARTNAVNLLPDLTFRREGVPKAVNGLYTSCQSCQVIANTSTLACSKDTYV